MTEAVVESPGNEPEKKIWALDWEEEPDPGGGLLPLIDREYFYDLLMEEQEQMKKDVKRYDW